VRGENHRSGKSNILRWVLGISVLVLVLVIPLSLAFAVHNDGLFELGDSLPTPEPGSADIQGDDSIDGPDWEDIFDSNGDLKPAYSDSLTAVFIEDQRAYKGNVDDTTFTGSKNDDLHSTWKWVTGNVPPKDDLSNVYMYATPNAEGELILYAGLERLDPGGDSHIDIEINQDPIGLDQEPPCTDGTCSFTGEKTENDILVVMDFEKGGDLGFVEIHYWNGTQWVQKSVVNNGSGEGCDDDDTVCAFNNGNEIPGGDWPSYDRQGNVITDLPKNAFTEMGINVTQLLGKTPCFASVIAKSRSSSSITSDLKDFVIEDFTLCDARL
jgi:hypothetical protein